VTCEDSFIKYLFLSGQHIFFSWTRRKEREVGKGTVKGVAMQGAIPHKRDTKNALALTWQMKVARGL
jgi:hypothetical protein